MGDFLELSPPELRFRFELRKNVPVTLSLTNSTSERVAFKVWPLLRISLNFGPEVPPRLTEMPQRSFRQQPAFGILLAIEFGWLCCYLQTF